VATAALSPAEIASPIRSILRRKETSAHPGQGSAIDVARQEVLAETPHPVRSVDRRDRREHAYFGNDWASFAPGLKTIDDATHIRRRILLASERAEDRHRPGRAATPVEFRRGRRRPDRNTELMECRATAQSSSRPRT